MKLPSKVLLGVAAAAGIALAAASDMNLSPDPADAPRTAGAASTPSASALPEGHPDVSGATASGAALSGEVRETLDGGGYTYLRLATADGEVWAAGPETDVSPGETVTLVGVLDMGAFSSPSLDRDFDRLYFADRIVEGEATGSTAGGGPAADPDAVGGGAPDAAPGAVDRGAAPVGAPNGVAGDFRGIVEQAIPVSRYVYLEVETGEGPVWLAAPEMAVAKGDEVRWDGGTLMRDFTSSTLGRTFDAILFVSRLEVVGD